MTTVIGIANQKGGVGKTTTAVSIAHGLTLRRKNVLLIDLDPQGQSAISLGLKAEPGAYYLLTPPPSSPITAKNWIRKAREYIPGENGLTFLSTKIKVPIQFGQKLSWYDHFSTGV